MIYFDSSFFECDKVAVHFAKSPAAIIINKGETYVSPRVTLYVEDEARAFINFKNAVIAGYEKYKREAK